MTKQIVEYIFFNWKIQMNIAHIALGRNRAYLNVYRNLSGDEALDGGHDAEVNAMIAQIHELRPAVMGWIAYVNSLIVKLRNFLVP